MNFVRYLIIFLLSTVLPETVLGEQGKAVSFQLPKDKKSYFQYYAIHYNIIVFTPEREYHVYNQGHMMNLSLDNGSWRQEPGGRIILQSDQNREDSYVTPMRYKSFTFIVWENPTMGSDLPLSEIISSIDANNCLPYGIYSHLEIDEEEMARKARRKKTITAFMLCVFPLAGLLSSFLWSVMKVKQGKFALNFQTITGYIVAVIAVSAMSLIFIGVIDLVARMPYYYPVVMSLFSCSAAYVSYLCGYGLSFGIKTIRNKLKKGGQFRSG